MIPKKLLDNQVEETLLKETRETFATGFLFAPFLYLGFWAVDCFYAPDQMWKFLGLRVTHGLFVAGLYFYFKQPRSLRQYQIAGASWAAIASNLITIMILMTSGPASIYYAGLNLVALLAIFFIPYRPKVQWFALATIFIPYLIGCGLQVTRDNFTTYVANSAFVFGTVLIGVVIKKVQFRTRIKEVEAQLALASEVADREEVIQVKTTENVKLSRLSNQFSPQVVEAIRTGALELSVSAKRSLISTIFIDIVNSTERVVRVDNAKVNKVIGMFLEDTARILLKYDITIDKFLGDGILAFANDPVRHSDFVERTVRAAMEIRERISSRQEEYENLWMNKLEIRIGIAHGYANVGFYGNEKLYKCYTAIGPVVNLACRLSAAADPNEILITHDVFENMPTSQFVTASKGKLTLKGFEQDLIKCYSIDGYAGNNKAVDKFEDDLECSNCHQGIFYLASNDKGQFVFKCRHCGFVQEQEEASASLIKRAS